MLPMLTFVVLKLLPDEKPVPVSSTVFPPVGVPALGDTPVTAGTGAYAYVSDEEVWLPPPTVVTLMSTVAAMCEGRSSIVICAALTTLKHGLVGDPGHGVVVMLVVSTDTFVVLKPVPLKPVPFTVTVLVPPRAPAGGTTLVTAGSGA